MDFKEATDDLCDTVSHEELAKALGVSVATVRQARLQASAKAHRSPPENWKEAVARLADQQIERYRRLLRELKAMPQSASD
jgi:hypothetical protein